MDERRDRRRRDRDRDRDRGGEERRSSRDSSRHKESSSRRKEHDSDRREEGKRKRNWDSQESERGDDKRKKHSDPKEGENAGQDKKRKEPPEEPTKPSAPTNVTANGKTPSELARIKEIVEKKRKEIAEKLKKVSQQTDEVVAPKPPAATTKDAPLATNMDEAIKRAQECVTRLGFQQAIPLQPVAGTPASAKAVQAPPLLVDSRGRQIDEHGAVVNQSRAASVSTLKVNINKQKRDAFQILHPELEEDPVNNPHFDSNLRLDKTKLVRQKRSTFQFVEQGKWAAQAEAFKLDNLLGQAKAREIRAKQAILAKAKAEGDVNPNLIEVSERASKDDGKLKDPVPDVEWWDAVLLPTGNYSDVSQGIVEFRREKINIYVEHPVPIEPPAELAPPPPQPIKLTKKEQKKVLASEATQDPTRLEQEIRSAAAERERAHVDRNLARKLTPAERREKKEKKLFDDPNTPETIVSVYRVKGISHSQTRFKVDVNAQENRLTGCALITDAMAVIIVEGGLKSIKRYDKLMMRRINWGAREDGVEAEEEQQESSKCIRVWQGSVARPAFERFSFHKCHTAAAARKFLDDLEVAHYWDSAVEAAPVPEMAGASAGGDASAAAVAADAPPPLLIAESS